jgi:hypothetical protein
LTYLLIFLLLLLLGVALWLKWRADTRIERSDARAHRQYLRSQRKRRDSAD